MNYFPSIVLATEGAAVSDAEEMNRWFRERPRITKFSFKSVEFMKLSAMSIDYGTVLFIPKYKSVSVDF